MAKYDLTSSLETSFTFSINGKEYSFRKPTVREMRSVAKEFSLIEKEEDVDKQVELSNKAMQALYAFISPVGHDTPISEILDDAPVGVQIAFNEMVQKELGAK